MDEQRIEKVTQKVHFELADRHQLDGEVFLRLYESHHTGHQMVGDLLNESLSFIPVKTAGGVFLLSASQIVTAAVSSESEKDDLMTLGKQYTVRIKTTLDEEIRGDIFVNLPEESSRVKDYFNQPARFFPLFQPASILYINRQFILTVQE
jgi:hypothetical protein